MAMIVALLSNVISGAPPVPYQATLSLWRGFGARDYGLMLGWADHLASTWTLLQPWALVPCLTNFGLDFFFIFHFITLLSHYPKNPLTLSPTLP